ncbi:MAG: hypothetical protein WCI27_10165 [Candidatus Omnitrophota bacterium]
MKNFLSTGYFFVLRLVCAAGFFVIIVPLAFVGRCMKRRRLIRIDRERKSYWVSR